LTAAVAWLAGSLNLWGYFRLLGTGFVVWLGIFGGVALVAAGAVLLFRALALRGARWSAVVAFPGAWVTLEYVRNLATPHGTAGSLAYTQLKFLPFLQLASITGPWGMSFLLLCFPAAFAIGLHLRRTEPKAALRIVATTVGVIAAVLVFGAARLAVTPRGPMVKVGLVASDLQGNVDVAKSGAATTRLMESYAAEAEALIGRGARVVVLPEKLGVVLDAEKGSADPIFQQVAERTGATIVVGEVYVAGSAKYNQARIYQPQAEVLSYDKQHMLPPFESYLTPGRSLVTLQKPTEGTGVAICKDMDFTPLSRKYGEAGMGLMLVPGWDFNVDRN
jgi:apolipoprotein N-acyltransferase